MNKMYKKILAAVGLDVDADGFIIMDDGDFWTVNKTKVALPNTQAAKELRIVDGNPTIILFNPIQDNVLKVSPVMRKLVSTYNSQTEIALINIMSLGYMATSSDIKLPPTISMFILALSNAKGNAKKLMDDAALKTLMKATEWSVVNDKKIIKLFPVNGITVCGEKVMSAISYTSPLLEEVEDDESELHPILKRRKDRDLLEYCIKYFMEYLSTDGEYIMASSNAEVAPMLTTFLKAVNRSGKKINTLLKGLSRLDKERCDEYMLPDGFDSDFISSIQDMEAESSKVVRVDGTGVTRNPIDVRDNVNTDIDDQLVVPGTTIKRKSQQGGYQQPMYQSQPARSQQISRHDQLLYSRQPAPMYNTGHPQVNGYNNQPVTQHNNRYASQPQYIGVIYDERMQRFYDVDGYEVPQEFVQEDNHGMLFTELPVEEPVQPTHAQSVQFRR